MRKVIKTFKAIFAILKNPWLLNKILSNDEVWKKKVEKKYSNKNSLPVVDIKEFIKSKIENIKYLFLAGSALPTDILLLKALCKKFEKCKYFEIGTWRGESVLNIADVATECYTLNLTNTEMKTIGIDDETIKMNGYLIKNKSNISQLYGNSLYFNFKNLKKKFDVIFIDGNHNYKYVKNDTLKVYENLIHENSIIVWHDYAHTPEKIRPEVLMGILDGLPKNEWKHLYHVSNTKCAIYIKENFKTEEFCYPQKPKHLFKIAIKHINL